MLDLGTDFPGVAPASQREVWRGLSPDPNLIARLPAEIFPSPERSKTEILARRSETLGKSLSLSYRQPLKIVRGWRQYLYDENGRAYLDVVNNVCHVGHSHPRVVQALAGQAYVLNTNTRYLHDSIITYAERLLATLPPPLSVLFLVCSGSEANELALRLARAHSGAADFIVVDGAYHGNTQALIEISPYKHDGPGGRGTPPHVHKALMPDPYRGVYKGYGRAAGHAYAQHVAEIVEELNRGGRGERRVSPSSSALSAVKPALAGFIVESVLGCGGQIVLPQGYLPEAFTAVRAAGGVCIADEVQVGFGRVGSHFWGFETQGVVPDIVTMGKPIGNGHPLAAVATTRAIADSFANGMEYFNTFGGNPVSCAVGTAVLDVIVEENLQQNALDVGNHLLARLTTLTDKYSLVGDVRGLGLFIGIELVRSRETLEPAAWEASYVVERMKEEGILLSTDGPLHNVIKLKPPLVFTHADANYLADTLDKILAEDPVQ
ncbi:MAG: aminotransferase class III-fold pyridoxal phosphate-dependent enzyme [Chloroflexi bacterium]|nr:aminotransferase class III-fold pyridoxal phosphate-dependent enzyme [Chloroflexota bacterium]